VALWRALKGGKRRIEVRYSNSDCRSRFTLEKVRYEFGLVEKKGKWVPEGPPFLTMKLRKHRYWRSRRNHGST